MTEIGGLASKQTIGCEKLESVGFVVENVELKVVDVDNGRSLGPNQPGECYVKTSTMMVGYYNNSDATKSTIDQEGKKYLHKYWEVKIYQDWSTGWIHTGDLVYYTKKGEIIISDRIKDVMKFRGHHVSPNELEECILKHAAVMEAVVVPVPHDLDIERPMAFVKKVPGCQVIIRALLFSFLYSKY